MTSSRDHHDNRGVFVELWVLDLVQNDYPAAILLSQLMWWAQPAKDGRPKLGYERDGHLWLVRPDDQWHDETRLTPKQVRTAKERLKAAGLIITRRVKRGTAVVSAMRPDFDTIRDQADAGTEYARSGRIAPNPPDTAVLEPPDRVGPYLLTTTPELLPSEENDEQASSPSSRFSANARAKRDDELAGLPASTETHVAAAATWTPKHRRPRAQDQRARDRAARAQAIELAGRLMAEVVPPLSPNVAALQSEIDQMLANGFTLEQIDAAARHPECLAWSYKALAFLVRKASMPTAPQRPLAPRPGPPPPPVVVAAPVQRPTGDELATIKARNAEVRAERARAKAGAS